MNVNEENFMIEHHDVCSVENIYSKQLQRCQIKVCFVLVFHVRDDWLRFFSFVTFLILRCNVEVHCND